MLLISTGQNVKHYRKINEAVVRRGPQWSVKFIWQLGTAEEFLEEHWKNSRWKSGEIAGWNSEEFAGGSPEEFLEVIKNNPGGAPEESLEELWKIFRKKSRRIPGKILEKFHKKLWWNSRWKSRKFFEVTRRIADGIPEDCWGITRGTLKNS